MVESLRNALDVFLSYIPQLIGAIVILIVGYIVDRAQTRETPATVLGKLVFWLVFIIAITMAADALGIRQVSAVLAQLIAYIPSIIAAILILVLAALLANFLAGIVRGATGSDLLANIARYAIIVYAAALAAAIAFGWGGRDVAKEIIENAYHRRHEVTSDAGLTGDTTATG